MNLPMRYQAELLGRVGQAIAAARLDNTLIYWNNAAAKLYGWSAEEAIGRDAAERIAVSDAPEAAAARAAALQRGDDWAGDTLVRCRDGAWLPISYTVTPLNDEHGARAGWVSIATDLTEHRRAEEAQRQRDAILEAVAFAAERFLMTPDWQAHIQAVLARFGQRTNSSHVYIFELHRDQDGVLVSSMRHEWAAPGIPPDIGNPLFQNSPVYHPDFLRWAETLHRGQLFQGNLNTFLPNEAEILVPRGIKSLLDVPIVVDGVWWGIIGFDDYEIVREWSQAEMEALKTAAGIISAAIRRQQADRALRESERLHREAIEAAGAVPYYQEYGPGDTSAYTFMSEGIRHLTGFGPDEITPQIWDSLVQEMVILGEYAGLPKEEAIHRSRSGVAKVWQCDFRIRTPAGETRWVADTAVEILNDQGRARASIGIMQDITERKRIENELRLSEERYRLVSSVSSDYTFSSMLDAHGQLQLNWATGAFETITGYTMEEFVARGGWIASVHPDDRDHDAQDMARLHSNQRVASELRIIRKDQSIRWVRSYAHPVWDDERGQLVGIYGAVQDITDRKQAEQVLRDYVVQAQQRADQLAMLNEVSRAVSTLQDLDTVLDVILDQVRRTFPMDAFYICLYAAETNEIVFPLMYDSGQRWEEPVDQLSPSSHIATVLHTGRPLRVERSAEEVERVLATGVGLRGVRSRASASCLMAPMQEGSRVIGLIAVHSYAFCAYTDADLALLHGVAYQAAIAINNARLHSALQQELREREALIRELEGKNAELERFTYTVSHDLKSPLITIGGFLGFLEKDALSGNTVRLQSDIQRIKEAADKMRHLLDDLLELSRIGRLMNPARQVPFAEIVADALALVGGQLSERGVAIEVAPELPSAYGDRARLVELLQNLIDNAAKFMGDQPQPRIAIGVREQGEERIFYVQDNGIGIDPKYQQKIFGLFEKLDPEASGTGIGLALVKRIAEVHGGRIWVESEGVGRGATFCFVLPDEPAE